MRNDRTVIMNNRLVMVFSFKKVHVVPIDGYRFLICLFSD